MIDNIIVVASAAATFVKIIIDIVKMAADVPRWLPPALALLLGMGAVLLLMVGADQPLTTAALAQAILAGIMAGGMAVGVTELQRHSQTAAAERKQP